MAKHVTELFSRWHDERLAADERRVVAEHLEGCGACEVYYRKMTLLLRAGPRDVPRLQPDPLLPQRVRASAETHASNVPKAWRPSFASLSLGAAALALAVTLGVVIGSNASASLAPQQLSSNDDTLIYRAYTIESFANGWDTLITAEDGELQ